MGGRDGRVKGKDGRLEGGDRIVRDLESLVGEEVEGVL